MGYPAGAGCSSSRASLDPILGFTVHKAVIDRPAKASWLTMPRKAHLRDKLAREARPHGDQAPPIWQTLAHPKVLLFAVVYTSLAIGIYGLSLWMPQIIKGMGCKDPLHIGLIMAVPYLIATICMVLWSRHSDKTGERVWHCAGPLALASTGMISSAYPAHRYSR